MCKKKILVWLLLLATRRYLMSLINIFMLCLHFGLCNTVMKSHQHEGENPLDLFPLKLFAIKWHSMTYSPTYLLSMNKTMRNFRFEEYYIQMDQMFRNLGNA